MIDPAPTADLARLAAVARYVGSPEHKSYPSPAGPSALRADATKCDPTRHGDFAELTAWVRSAIEAGRVGAPWDGEFPRYAWGWHDGVCYEARLVNAEKGEYKGYELLDSEAPGSSDRG